MATELHDAIAIRNQRRQALTELRARAAETHRKLRQSEKDAERTKLEFGQAVAARELGEPSDIPARKREYTDALAEMEGFESAHGELAKRIKTAEASVRESERAAIVLEIELAKSEAEQIEKETLRHAADLGRSHALWHAAARRAAALADALGQHGAQPVPFDGVHGQLSHAFGDGLGIVGVLNRFGISSSFSAIGDKLPRVPLLTGATIEHEDDVGDELDTEGCIVTAEALPAQYVPASDSESSQADE